MNTRVHPVSLREASPKVKEIYGRVFGEGVDPTADPGTRNGDGPGRNGCTYDIFTTLALVPSAFLAQSRLIAALSQQGRPLSARLRELVIMRVAVMSDCRFVYSQHFHVARELGMSEEEVGAIKAWSSSDLFDSTERAVMSATDELIGRGLIEEATFNRLKESLSDEAIGDVLCVATAYRFSSLIVRGLQLEYDADTTSRLAGIVG